MGTGDNEPTKQAKARIGDYAIRYGLYDADRFLGDWPSEYRIDEMTLTITSNLPVGDTPECYLDSRIHDGKNKQFYVRLQDKGCDGVESVVVRDSYNGPETGTSLLPEITRVKDKVMSSVLSRILKIYGKSVAAKVGLPELGEAKPAEVALYFNTNNSKIGPESAMPFADFVRAYGGANPVIIEGHCDKRGSSEYNFGLGFNRAEAVLDSVVGEFRKQKKALPEIYVVSFGKTKANETAQAEDRKTVLSTEASLERRAVGKVLGDYYLIDMDYADLGDVKKMQDEMQGKSIFYYFHRCYGILNDPGDVLNASICRKPLYAEIIENIFYEMADGQTMTIFTDGIDDPKFDSAAAQKVVDTANGHGIRINVMYRMKSPDKKKLNADIENVLKILVDGTGGSFYFVYTYGPNGN